MNHMFQVVRSTTSQPLGLAQYQPRYSSGYSLIKAATLGATIIMFSGWPVPVFAYEAGGGDDCTDNNNTRVAIGVNSQACGPSATAIGSAAISSASSSIAIGTQAQGTGVNSVAIGLQAQSTFVNSAALGRDARAENVGAVALGEYSRAGGYRSVAIGSSSGASGARAVSMGEGSQATDADAIAMGTRAAAAAGTAISLGIDSAARGAGDVAIGPNATASGAGLSSLSVGRNSSAIGSDTIGIGNSAHATADYGLALGNFAEARSQISVAIGNAAIAEGGEGAVSVGNNALARGVNATALGSGGGGQVGFQGARALADGATAVGGNSQGGATAGGVNSIAMGGASAALAENALAIGTGAYALGVRSISIGTGNQVAGTGSGAIGDPSYVTGNGTYTLGNNNGTATAPIAANNAGIFGNNNFMGENATGSRIVGNGNGTADAPIDVADVFIFGNNATATVANSVVLGSNSIANGSTLGNAPFQPLDARANAIAVSGINPVGEVSVGASDNERRITHVAAGSADTDAVNVSQLSAVNAKADYASQGFNIGVNGEATANVAPGAAVQFIDSENIELTRDGNNISVAMRPAITVDSLVVRNGPTIDNSGIDMNGGTVTNLGAPQAGGDAVNLSYFNANRSHYYSVNDDGVEAANYQNDGATGVGAIAIGMGAAASEEDAIAIGNGAEANEAGSIALGANSRTSPVRATRETTINGRTYRFAGDNPNATVSVGNQGSERTVTHVAAGRLGADSTDAINGSQLYSTNLAVEALNQGLLSGQTHYFSVNDSDGRGSNYDNDGATANGAVAVGINAQANAQDAVAFGNGAVADTANSLALGAGSVTAEAVGTTSGEINGQTYAYAGGAPVGTVSFGSAGRERTITHVAAGRISAQSTDAVNGSQLHATNQAVEAVQADVADVRQDVNQLDGRVTNIEGDVANLDNDIGQLSDRAVQYATNDDGSTDYSTISLAGDEGTTITNLAAGDISEGSSDAVNGGQLWAMQSQLTTINQSGIMYFHTNSNGPDAQPIGSESTSIGPRSVARGNDSVAMGNGAIAEAQGGVAIGAASRATREGMNGAREAFSNERVASTQGAVSVGDAGNERQITHVAGGTEATDAVNVRQLGAVQAGAVNYDRNADGSANYNSVTLGQGSSLTQIHNVAAGESDTDAANVGQLRAMGQNYQQQLSGLNRKINDVEDQANAGTASALAAASVPQATLAGKSMFSAGAATYQGQSAVSVGFSRLSDNGRWVTKFNLTSDTQNNFGAGVGVGLHW